MKICLLPHKDQGRIYKLGPDGVYYRCFGCYANNNVYRKNWADADKKCHGDGGRLASLHTEEISRFVRDHMPWKSEAWIGGFHEDRKWQWSNGNKWSYENGTLTGSQSTNAHAVRLNKDGMWVKEDKNQENAYICEFDAKKICSMHQIYTP